MKSKIVLFFFALLVSFPMISQTDGINYKAIIKDGSGNVVANDLIVVQFQILQGAGMTNVYQETHTPTTDANGMVIINIGTGSTSDVFADVDWGSDNHFLNVQINTGGGLTNMGTSQFMTVPYALRSENSNTSTVAVIANNLALKSVTTDQFDITYEASGDKLQVIEVGLGNVLEISNGELTLPEYAGTGTENISVDTNGKLIKTTAETPKNNQKYGVYDYFDVDASSPSYTLSTKSVHFQEGTILVGISALLLDNNAGTGGATNTNFVSLRRTPRSSISSSDELYRITGNNTAAGIYNTQTSTSLLVSGANVVDNANYLYFIQIYYCTDCDFREVSVLD